MKQLYFTSLFFALITIIYQSTPAGIIPLSVDYARYKGKGNYTIIEFYISFYQNNLIYNKNDKIFTAEYKVSIQIQQNDSTLYQNTTHRISNIDSLQQILPSNKFLDFFCFQLLEGSYKAKIKIIDNYSGKMGEYFLEFSINPFPTDSLTLSDVQFASRISQDSTSNEFQKNSYIVIPNPENIYSITMPVLYYYAELYNLTKKGELEGEYSLRVSITDQDGKISKDYPEKIVPKPGDSAVLVGGHNVVTLTNGIYSFNIEAIDLQNGSKVSVSKAFSFLRPTRKKIFEEDSIDISSSDQVLYSAYVNLDESEMDLEFSKAKYIATSEEIKIYTTLDIEGKRQFLYNFWQKFDWDPSDNVNEFKENYFNLANYATLNFSVMKKEGWKSDRGRVLLTYGRPNEIDRYHMSVDKAPYEIWQYHELEGGVIFVFADLSGFGDFELLHSTYSKEFYQPDWERLIIKTRNRIDFYNR